MGNYEAWSEDKRYGLRIPNGIMQRILHCCKKVGDVETGGILVGYYNRRYDCAIVTDSSKAPQDSKREKRTFYRGVKGLQKWLNQLWILRKKRYYLGEWHFHPFAIPGLSGIDINQIKSNSESNSYHCPEPVLFIVGGDPNTEWSCKSFVYVKEKGSIELIEQWESI